MGARGEALAGVVEETGAGVEGKRGRSRASLRGCREGQRRLNETEPASELTSQTKPTQL